MLKEIKNHKPLLQKSIGTVNSSFFTFDIPTLIANLKQSQAWENGELNAMILLKSPEKQIVLTALHGGTEIRSYQSNDSITFHIIEGKLDFHSKKESVTIDQGQMLTLHENIKYRLISDEETVFLLTTSNDIQKKHTSKPN